MSDCSSKHRDLLESFQCLTPDSLLNKSPTENKERLIKILKEYGERNEIYVMKMMKYIVNMQCFKPGSRKPMVLKSKRKFVMLFKRSKEK